MPLQLLSPWSWLGKLYRFTKTSSIICLRWRTGNVVTEGSCSMKPTRHVAAHNLSSSNWTRISRRQYVNWHVHCLTRRLPAFKQACFTKCRPIGHVPVKIAQSSSQYSLSLADIPAIEQAHQYRLKIISDSSPAHIGWDFAFFTWTLSHCIYAGWNDKSADSSMRSVAHPFFIPRPKFTVRIETCVLLGFYAAWNGRL